MNDTKLIMENWRGYVKVCQEEDRITAEKTSKGEKNG
jgi:hypothetical protein